MVLFYDSSENSDAPPVVVKIRQQEEHLPDFGGWSPIREEEEEDKRCHGTLTRLSFLQMRLEFLRNCPVPGNVVLYQGI